MKYRDPQTGEFKDITVKVADTLPVGTIVEYDGDNIPNGWELVDGSGTYKKIKKTETITATNGTIVDSLAGNSKTNAPSINAVNNKFKEISTYSTEEKVIGKWIDGKTLYRKTITHTITTNNQETIPHNINNLQDFINISGNFKNNYNYYMPISAIEIFGEVTNIYVKSINYTGICNIILEYTKTTDSATNTTEVINDESILEEPTI